MMMTEWKLLNFNEHVTELFYVVVVINWALSHRGHALLAQATEPAEMMYIFLSGIQSDVSATSNFFKGIFH